ncbi:MAG: cell division protein FtsZ, partial [Kaistella sp.]
NVLLLIRSGSEEVTMDEIGVIMDHIQKEAGNTADIIFGVGTDEELGDAVSVLVIATGFAKDHQKHSGTSEKIKISLNDSMESSKASPFKPRGEKEEITRENFARKSLFVLDDEDDLQTPQFSTKTVEKKTVIERETATEMRFFDLNEDSTPDQTFNIDEGPQELDLFSFEDDEFETPVSESFKFETEEIIEEKTTETHTSFSEEKPMEFSFFVNEPIEEPKVETPQPKAEIKEQPVQKTEIKVQPVIEEPQETTKLETADDFTFISKVASNDKVVERRNKLREFNSRYQTSEAENDFETVPAFRRKNISIESGNASEQKINSFLAENNGRMQVRENRFLNKDVD